MRNSSGHGIDCIAYKIEGGIVKDIVVIEGKTVTNATSIVLGNSEEYGQQMSQQWILYHANVTFRKNIAGFLPEYNTIIKEIYDNNNFQKCLVGVFRNASPEIYVLKIN